MDDILKMEENKALAKTSVKKKSKYTVEQKIAAQEALELSKKLNEMLLKTIKKHEAIRDQSNT
jgi:hypothetical protein